ncbi:MAG: hypothetical protein PW734_00425 [Verrucomicrobium sp.]|nr:hypothetical protein [Verrucomicrobium sp.]
MNGPVFFTADPVTGTKADAPVLQEMVDDAAATRHFQETICALAAEAGMPEAEARALFLKEKPRA